MNRYLNIFICAVFFVFCGLYLETVIAVEVDCGFKFQESGGTVTGACEDTPTSTHKLRIRKGASTYGIVLVDPADVDASKLRIQTAAGTKAIKKFSAGPGHNYDTGDETDGACNWGDDESTLAAATFNCTTVNITNTVDVTGNATTPLIIKATGNVMISGTLDLKGVDVADNVRGPTSANDGGGGDGGKGGGSAGAGATDGFPGYGAPSSCGGKWSNPSGPGGGGGAFGGEGAAGVNANGSTSTVSVGGTAFGSDFGNESGAPVEPILYGGCGGGGGAFSAGLSGGPGGGVVSIVSDGTINISGTITANGGQGSNRVSGDQWNGAGGGGSGGGIFLAGSNIVNDGTVSARGGGGGDNTMKASNPDADGGGGGGGRIRTFGTTTGSGTFDVSGGTDTHGNGANGVLTQE